MGDFVNANSWSDAAMMTWRHLTNVPGAILSPQGVTNGAGFVVFRYIRGMIQPIIDTATMGLPAAPYFRAINNGIWDLALFGYAVPASGQGVVMMGRQAS